MENGLGIVKKENEPVTVDKLKELFPSKKGTITDKTVELVNGAMNDPEFDGYKMLDAMNTYQNVMYKNSGSLDQFIDAVKFCAYLESTGDRYVEAYKKTFNHRKFVQERMDVSTESTEYRELTNAASRYRKSPMVIDILTMADVPLYLMFQGFRYQAVSRLATEMEDAAYSKDRISAAKALLENVKPPENIKLEMEVGPKESSAISSLEDQLAEIASKQLHHLEHGTMDLSDMGSMKPKDNVIDAEVE